MLYAPTATAQDDNDFFRNPLVKHYLGRLKTETEFCDGDTAIFISLQSQVLYLIKGNRILKRYSISSSKFGIGCTFGSGQTPEGIHRIWRKIGHQSKQPYIYMWQKNTGKKAKIVVEPRDTRHDYVTSRILWLEGVEEGYNCGGDVDSYHRNIYIHGTSEEGLIGSQASDGCIRMLNKDVIQLYKMAPRLTYVVIMNDMP